MNYSILIPALSILTDNPIFSYFCKGFFNRKNKIKEEIYV